MNLSSVSSITLQQFEVFLSAAKYENFTKAADELHMTQASVSRNIAALEETLGLILFVRHKRRVRLTEAGKLMAAGLKDVFDQLDITLGKAFDAQKCQYNTLRIGDYNTTPGDAYLLPSLECFEEICPGIDVSVERADPLSVMSGLLDGRYDAVFFSSAGKIELKNMKMEFVQLIQLPPCIVISRKHRLFGQKNIDFRELAGDTIVTMAVGGYSYYWEYARGVLNKYGFPFANIKYVNNPHTMAMELRRGKCIALMDRFYMPMDRNDLRYVEIPDCPQVLGFGLAYSPDNTNPFLPRFIAAAKTATQQT